jgi:hypothetical protein
MNLHRFAQMRVPVLLVIGYCLTGCIPGNKNASPNTKVNPLGPFPVIQRTMAELELQQIGLVYLSFTDTNGRPPANLDELDLKLQYPKYHQAILEKRYIIYWNANRLNAPAGMANTVLGYDADVLTKKSAVLMLDGSVTVMTPEEFKQAAKAG